MSECLMSPWGQSWERVFLKHKCIQFIARVHWSRSFIWSICSSFSSPSSMSSSFTKSLLCTLMHFEKNLARCLLSNEVFEDLILRGSSWILVPQTPGIKYGLPKIPHPHQSFPRVLEEQNQFDLHFKNLQPFCLSYTQNHKNIASSKTPRNPEEHWGLEFWSPKPCGTIKQIPDFPQTLRK